MMKRLWVWGAGELGGRVAQRWHRLGGDVIPLTRTEERHPALRQAGLSPRVGNPDAMAEDDCLLISIAGTQALVDAIAQLQGAVVPSRVVITGSTGYYGLQGGEISRSTPPGQTERAIAINDMEERFSDWSGSRGVVLRIGGLYRQGRGPLNALKVRGTAPLNMAPDRVIPLVHYDDAASACMGALTCESPKASYLVVSPPCPTRREFYLAACVMLELPLPSFGKAVGGVPATYDVSETLRDLNYSVEHPKWQEALVP